MTGDYVHGTIMPPPATWVEADEDDEVNSDAEIYSCETLLYQMLDFIQMAVKHKQFRRMFSTSGQPTPFLHQLIPVLLTYAQLPTSKVCAPLLFSSAFLYLLANCEPWR